MIHVTENLLAMRARALSQALMAGNARSEDSDISLQFVAGLTNPWMATAAGRPRRQRARWFTGRGTSVHQALDELVRLLSAECTTRDLQPDVILRSAQLK